MKTFIFAALLPLLLAGCWIAPYRETAYYDLSPKSLPKGAGMTVADFQNRSGAGSRFQYRGKDGSIRMDPDHKWIVPPGALVANGIRRAAAPDQRKPAAAGALRTMHVSGELLTFEVDLARKDFHLYAIGEVRPLNGKAVAWSRDIRIPLKNSSPESVVLAASQAVYDLAEHVIRTGGK